MRYELRKILGNPSLCLLLSAVVIINALMFFARCTDASDGFTMKQMQTKFNDIAAVKLQQRMLDEISEENDNAFADKALLTGDIYYERQLNGAVLDRVSQAETYEEYRRELIAESEIKLRLGIFGNADSFEARSLERGVREYKRLSGITPSTSFFGGIEISANWHISDVFLLVFCITAPFVLFTNEKAAGLKIITYPTGNGHNIHCLRKLGASCLLMSAGFVLLYGANVLIAASLFGIPDLSAPIQSVYGYAGCTMRVTVGEFCLLLTSLKYLWATACFSVAAIICSLSDSAAYSSAGIAVIAVVSLLLGGSNILWMKSISLAWLINTEKLFNGAMYLNLFGVPIRRVSAAAVFLILFTILSSFLTLLAYNIIPAVPNGKKQLLSLPSAYPCAGIFGHECRKAFFMWKGAVILLAFILIQTIIYKNLETVNTENEIYYRYYSTILAGKPSDEKDRYIEEEKERFITLNNRLAEAASSSDAVNGEVRDIQNQLKAQEAFERSCEQYEGLENGQSYLYQTPYTKIFGTESCSDNITNFAKLFLVLTLLLSPLFAFEEETGVKILQTASGMLKRINIIKILIVLFYAIISALISFLPKYAAVFNLYGGLDMSARANSIDVFKFLPNIWSVSGISAAAFGFCIAAAVIASALIAWLSAKTKNSVITLVISLAVLLIPTAIMFLLTFNAGQL